MVSKNFAVLFVALFAFQASEANIIDNIIEQMGSSMNQTMQQMKENLANMERAAGNVMDGIQGKVLELQGQAAEAIQQYAEQAQQLGADITECQKAAQEAFDKVKDASTTGIRECLSTLRKAMQPDLDLMDNDMHQVQALATEAAKNFSACGYINPSCQMKVIANVARQATTVGRKVMADGTTFAHDFAPARSQFTSCAQAEMSSAASAAQDTIKKEIQCIQDKIQEEASSQ